MFQSIIRGSLICCVAFVAVPSLAVDLVQNHQPACVVILPDQAINMKVAEYAAEELQYHVQQATGAMLTISRERDSEKISASIKGRVYIGDCRAVRQAGINVSILPVNAFIIRSAGSNLFLAGKDGGEDRPLNDHVDMGTLFAVYEFLETQMGVRWLWPGKLGEIIPACDNLSIPDFILMQGPVFRQAFWWNHNFVVNNPRAWSNATAHYSYFVTEQQWLRRHRFVRNYDVNYGEAFLDYWKRFGKAHPEYFNLLPNGKREPDPGRGDLNQVAMCESEPGLWKRIVEDWKQYRTARRPWVNCTPNDTPGKCICPRCLSWDVHAPDEKVSIEAAKKAFLNGPNDGWTWVEHLGSLSDRYARFFLAVQKEAEKFDPQATTVAYAYANYLRAPISTRLNDRVIIWLAPSMFFPYPESKSRQIQRDIKGWVGSGATVAMRPNVVIGEHNFPFCFAKRIGNDFAYAYKLNRFAVDLDSLTGQWAAQGPTLYVIARIHENPDEPVDHILNEYYGVFGPARDTVRAYFQHWTDVTDAISEEKYETLVRQFNLRDKDGLSFRTVYRAAGLFLTPQVLARGHDLLDKAKREAKGDALTAQRVSFLEKGLEHAEMTLATQAGFEDYRKTGKLERFSKALRALDDFRVRHEGDFISNPSPLVFNENILWDRSLVKLMAIEKKTELTGWRFRFDPDNIGQANGWQNPTFDDAAWVPIATDKCWEEQAVGQEWKKKHGKNYDGLAWYRCRFSIPDTGTRGYRLIFGAVDEACIVWLNGRHILDRPYPYQGDSDSWAKPFEVDVSGLLLRDKPNVLVVRVQDNQEAGGIWKPVWVAPKP